MRLSMRPRYASFATSTALLRTASSAKCKRVASSFSHRNRLQPNRSGAAVVRQSALVSRCQLGECRYRGFARRLVGVRSVADVAVVPAGPHPGAILRGGPAIGRCGRRRCLFLASGGASMPKCWHVSAGGREPGLMFRRFVSAQTVVNDGDLRQRKISERDALVIGGKQNDVREHVANLADNLEQDCVLCVCHGSTRASSANRATAALVAVATAQQETAGTVLRLRR